MTNLRFLNSKLLMTSHLCYKERTINVCGAYDINYDNCLCVLELMSSLIFFFTRVNFFSFIKSLNIKYFSRNFWFIYLIIKYFLTCKSSLLSIYSCIISSHTYISIELNKCWFIRAQYSKSISNIWSLLVLIKRMFASKFDHSA